ncbi:MAG: ATP-dependent DNA helicase [Candidatus Tyrphobacter sp.]
MTASVDEIFGARGPLARALDTFEARPGQLQMANLVERGMLEGVHTIVEAGTGVGKSLAYLVPAVRSGKKVVLSTGTIALQEQLVDKDIPLVVRALDIPLRVTMLKGRRHYLCKEKYERLRGERLLPSSQSMGELWKWAQRTRTGDRSEVRTPVREEEWEQVDADADDCIGEFCDYFRDCWFFKKRDEARYADLVVVNHALFFLDLAIGGGLVPPYDVAVLDEAHQCERWATDALTAAVSRRSVARMMKKLHRVYRVDASLDAQVGEGLRGLEHALAGGPRERYALEENDALWPALQALRDALYHLENWLQAHWQDALARPVGSEPEAERRRDLAMRPILAHIAALERVQAPRDESISWVERSDLDGRYEVKCAPHDVAGFLAQALFSRTPTVLTSATLAFGGSFEHLRRALGIADAQELVAPSPFDYARQARLFIAPPTVNPKASDFARRAAPIVEECLDRSRGRAFVLFTSYARLRELHALLRDRLPFPIALQGDRPRSQLLEWFRRTPNAVLFATGTFWEGIDVAGDRLSCVVIDRLPFPSPGDPLVAAKMASLASRGLDAFEEYMIPMAAMRLKQGFGRLIRNTADRGVVAILDGRASSARYGAAILGALPGATRIEHLDELTELFN